jgi:hypothetical protein
MLSSRNLTFGNGRQMNDPADLLEWIDFLKSSSGFSGAWPYFDPEGQQALPVKPRDPGEGPAEGEEVNVWIARSNMFNNRFQMYQAEVADIKRVEVIVLKTIGPNYSNLTAGMNGPDTVKAVYDACVTFSPQVKKQLVAHWAELLQHSTFRSMPLEAWRDDVLRTYDRLEKHKADRVEGVAPYQEFIVTVSTVHEVSYWVAKVKEESKALTDTNIVTNLGTFRSFVHTVIEVLVEQIAARDPIHTINLTFGGAIANSAAESAAKPTTERVDEKANNGENPYRDAICDCCNIKGHIVPSCRILKRVIMKDDRGNTNETLWNTITRYANSPANEKKVSGIRETMMGPSYNYRKHNGRGKGRGRGGGGSGYQPRGGYRQDRAAVADGNIATINSIAMLNGPANLSFWDEVLAMIDETPKAVPVVNYTPETWSKMATVWLEKQASADQRSVGDRNGESDAEEPSEASEEGPEANTSKLSSDHFESDRESTAESVGLVPPPSSPLPESFFHWREAEEEDDDSALTDTEEVLVPPTPIVEPPTPQKDLRLRNRVSLATGAKLHNTYMERMGPLMAERLGESDEEDVPMPDAVPEEGPQRILVGSRELRRLAPANIISQRTRSRPPINYQVPGSFSPEDDHILAINHLSVSDILSTSVIVDGGANLSAFNDRDRFESYTAFDRTLEVSAGSIVTAILGEGVAKVAVFNEDWKKVWLRIKGVYFPGLHTSVISQSQLRKNGFYHDDLNDCFRSLNTNTIAFRVERRFGLYLAESGDDFTPQGRRTEALVEEEEIGLLATIRSRRVRPVTAEASAEVWHERLAHPGPVAMEQMTARAGVKVKGIKTVDCNTCGITKVTRVVWMNPQKPRTDQPFGHVVVDIMFYPNPETVTGRGQGALLHLTCVNTHVRIASYIPNKSGDELFDFLRTAREQLRGKYDVTMAWIQCDNERGIAGIKMSKRLEALGFELISTSRDTPHQNPAEPNGRVLASTIRRLAVSTGLPTHLWPQLADMAVHILNRTPQQRLGWKSPLESLSGWLRIHRADRFGSLPEEPIQSLAHLRVPGCKVFIVNKFQRVKKSDSKLAPIGLQGYLCGYKSTSQYRIFIPQLQRVVDSADVLFNEKVTYKSDTEEINTPISSSLRDDLSGMADLAAREAATVEVEDFAINFNTATVPATVPPIQQTDFPDPATAEATAGAIAEPPTDQHGLITPSPTPSPAAARFALINTLVAEEAAMGRLYSARATRVKRNTLARPVPAGVPKHWGDVLHSREREAWMAAAHAEVQRLREKSVFEEISADTAKQHGWKPIATGWVFTEKAGGKKKGRVVVRGDQQPDLGLETYAATIAARTYRLLCAVAAKFGLSLVQYDTVAAFCNAPLPDEEVVVVTPPAGYSKTSVTPVYWKLKKALYGLRRAPLLWYQTLRSALHDIGLTTLREDSCVASNGRITVFWHVDDLIFM